MRLFSWAGCAALATAAGIGYYTSEAAHCRRHPRPVTQVAGMAEESDAGATAAPGALPPLPAEEIDLTCLPMKMPEELYHHTSEPPLAVTPGEVRTVSFEGPVAATEGPELPPAPTMPHLTDDTPPPPARLPMAVDDAEPMAANYPVRQCSEPTGPLWAAVHKFVADAAKILPTAHRTLPAKADDAEWLWDARWKPMCFDPFEDLPPENSPPAGEQQPAPKAGCDCPCCPCQAKCAPPAAKPRTPQRLAPIGTKGECHGRPDVDTMECRPGEGVRPPAGRPF
jgi:hypothetical protein